MKKKAEALKRAVFTVEAAVIVPIAVIITALLLGFIYYTHENIRTEAIAYEAEFYGVQKTQDDVTSEERIKERLNSRNSESELGFGNYSFTENTGKVFCSVNIKGSILPKLFGEVFGNERTVSIRNIDPVSAKRTMQYLGYFTDDK